MEELLHCLNTAQVTVICGETGCGKSTQCPQFILDDAIENGWGDKCQILCTQPRRISAIGVADRVADERAEKIGETVGYQIRLEKKTSSKTRLSNPKPLYNTDPLIHLYLHNPNPVCRLLFMTTGIMLRRLHGDPELTGITHVVIDEVPNPSPNPNPNFKPNLNPNRNSNPKMDRRSMRGHSTATFY